MNVPTATCSSRQNLGTIAFHHLEFETNPLNRSEAIYVHEPSCSSIQLINTTFQYNSCIGTCAASLVGQTWNNCVCSERKLKHQQFSRFSEFWKSKSKWILLGWCYSSEFNWSEFGLSL